MMLRIMWTVGLGKKSSLASYGKAYGISIDIIDNAKDYRLKRMSCNTKNLVGKLCVVTKEEARKLLIEKIDEALEALYEPECMQFVEDQLNVEKVKNLKNKNFNPYKGTRLMRVFYCVQSF